MKITQEFMVGKGPLKCEDFDLSKPLNITVKTYNSEIVASFTIGDGIYVTDNGTINLPNINVESSEILNVTSIKKGDADVEDQISVLIVGESVPVDNPEPKVEEKPPEVRVEPKAEETKPQTPQTEPKVHVVSEIPTIKQPKKEPKPTPKLSEDLEELFKPVDVASPARIKYVKCKNRDIWMKPVDNPLSFEVYLKGGKKGDILTLSFMTNQPLANLRLNGCEFKEPENIFNIDFKVTGYHASAKYNLTSINFPDETVVITIVNDPSEIDNSVVNYIL